MKSAALALVCSVFLLVPSLAYADEPLNGSGPETCTLEAFQKENRECVVCRAYYRNRDHCERVLPEYNFSKSCRTRDVSAWREVWCRKPNAASKKLPADLLASLDDATAGEKDRKHGRDAGGAEDDAAAPVIDGGALNDAAAVSDRSEPMVVRKPEGGCACAESAVGIPGGGAWSALLFATAAMGFAVTRYRKDRSGR